MAENIVAGLFGMTPQMYQGQQYQQDLKRGAELAQLSPGVAAQANLMASVGQLGRGFAGAMGIEDPQLQRITQRQQLLGMIDPSNPDSYIQAAQMALQSGDAEAAYALREQGTQARMQAMKNEDYLAQRGQRMQAQGLDALAQSLVTQLKNPDGSVNEEVKNRLLSFPQGQAAISQLAKVIPDLRRIGAMGVPEDNPFKVFIDDETIPKNVKTLATQYSTSLTKGILDPEKADVKVKELSEMTQRINQFEQNQTTIKTQQEQLNAFKSQGLANTQQSLAIQNAQLRLQEQNNQFQQQMKLDKAKRDEEIARTKPLPSYLAKDEEADYGTATAATNLASDANNFINRIKSGEIKFGLKDRATIRARQLVGSNDPDVLAREDYDKFLKVLTNESLRLNKGTQTEGDAVRAAKELESSESPQAAAAAMRRLVDINVRRTQNAADDVLRRRKNANFPEPERAIEVPKFDVQIIDNADYQRFLKNPKFPSGTVFIDPEGQRRTKP
jgi:myosin heavy subunit